MKEILVFLDETKDYGLLSRAAELAKDSFSVCAVVLTHDSGEKIAKEAFLYGADRVEVLKTAPLLADITYLAEQLMPFFKENQAVEIVLAPANTFFRSLLPYLAVQLKAGLTADCTEIDLNEENRLVQVRPALGNRLMASILTTSLMQMATVRTGVYAPKVFEKEVKEVLIHQISSGGSTRILSISQNEILQLNQAKVIFAAGAGIGSQKNFDYFENTVRKAGFAVGATRHAVELGYTSYAHQIGQTGVIVSPDVYVAFGISGAIQHLVGMRSSGKIIAVNTDKKAPIFDYADYGVYGDWQSTLDSIIKNI